jgi:hypothetical protein
MAGLESVQINGGVLYMYLLGMVPAVNVSPTQIGQVNNFYSCFLQVYCKYKCADWLVNWKKMSSNLELFTRFPCRLGLVPPRKGIKMILGMMYRYIVTLSRLRVEGLEVTSTAGIRRACQRCFIRIVSFGWNIFVICIRYR